ncbi:MAG: riboflavin kinase [Patescibacteria group bacterium]
MRITGKVIHGEGKGKLYGVPTANLAVQPEGLQPGIYVGSVQNAEQAAAPCIISWNQTFEVHVLDWSGDLYEQELQVEVGDRVSDFVPFESERQMKA